MKDVCKYIEQKFHPRELKRVKTDTILDIRPDPEAIKNLERVHADAKRYILSRRQVRPTSR